MGRRAELQRLADLYAPFNDGAAQIVGEPGTGKTALVGTFIERHGDLFPGGIDYTTGQMRESLSAIGSKRFAGSSSSQALVVVDEAEQAPPDEIQALLGIARAARGRVLLASINPVSSAPPLETLTLGGLTQSEYHDLLTKVLESSGADRASVDQLWKASAGNPAIGELASRSIRENLMTWRELMIAFEGFDRPGIVGPDGRPLRGLSGVPSRVELVVSDTNGAILNMLRRDPMGFRSLSPRKFEEIVAALLERKGFEVQLTPMSGDGGFDMYAAKNDGVGRFLYLVECKRWLPPNKVGVQVVRSLHGVVQQKRANAGVIVTTSFFTRGANEFRDQVAHQMHLRDYLELYKWLDDTA